METPEMGESPRRGEEWSAAPETPPVPSGPAGAEAAAGVRGEPLAPWQTSPWQEVQPGPAPQPPPPTFEPPFSSPYGSYYGGGWGGYGAPPASAFPGSAPPQPPASARRRLAAGAAIAALVLAAGVAGGVIGGHLSSRGSGTGSGSSLSPFSGSGGGLSPFGGGSSSGASGPSSSVGTGPSDASAIAQRVDPGLVDVNVTIDYGAAEGAGTGMVLTSNGLVLTNNHVVEGATAISVTDVGNGRTYSATVLGYDTSRDVALIQLDGASHLETVRLGNSAELRVGAQVVGIGNAGGAGGTPSFAGGTVTGLDRSLTASDELTGTTEQLSGMISTNADIVAGDSGGPLVTTSGAVVGMDTAGSGSFQLPTSGEASQGFAVPIDTAMSVARQIEAHRASATVHVGPTAFLGVQISSGGGGFFGSGSNSSVPGAPIGGVVSGSPASGAGLGAGDVITAVGGHTVTSARSLQQVMVTDEKPGESVKVVYVAPNGRQHTVSMTLASGPPQ
ncbi:MAG TPA: trypsin-like peptidase domain-containing protein [Acidimicrobiales bacterium]|nr:trypsin-like peptidase domain-containing protein [Acidimicrobiales bacterium]